MTNNTTECNHTWATYNEETVIQAIYYPDGRPIYQVCANCGKHRIGYPQPILWKEGD